LEKAAGWLIAAGFVLIIAIVGLNAGHLTPGQNYQQNMPQAGATVALGLLVVTLFVERSSAVVNALLFGDSQRNADLHLRNAGPDEIGAAQQELAAVMTRKERVRLLFSFASGILISVAGVRTLQGLLAIASPPVPPLTGLFEAVDVVLTAGLIAGGSNGLAFLVQLLKDLATQSSNHEIRHIKAPMSTTG
jgi:hypothetical protein